MWQTLTEREVAAILRCSVAALRRMRRERRGPKWTRVGRLVRYPEPWLREFIEQNANEPRQEAGQAQAQHDDSNTCEEHQDARPKR